MKNKYLYINGMLLSAALLMGSCNDYLKEDSGDLLIPKKVEEYSPMLYAEGYPSSFNSDVSWFCLMTDDVEMGQLEIDPNSPNIKDRVEDAFDLLHGGNGQQAYTWREDIEVKLIDGFWQKRYENILACNVVIDALPTMEYVEQDTGKYHYLAAQAYALRAYHYWCLVNTYALPYSAENLSKPGVVLRTAPQIDVAPKERASIGEVYRLINEDIQKAEQFIEISYISGNKHLLTKPAILLLASRIALFQEDWDEVIRTGKLFLEQNSAIFDLTTVDTTLLGADSNVDGFSIMDGKANEEIVFTFGNSSTTYDYLSMNTSGSFYGLGFRTSCKEEGSLIGSYEEGDLRKIAYFKKDIPAKKAESFWEEDKPHQYHYYYPVKYRRVSGSSAEKPNDKLYRENWRSVEVMLNLAEAYVRKTNTVHPEALELLNNLRRKRFDQNLYVDKQASDFQGSDDLLKFIWAERRRELCFEEAMRFWDLRRQGMPQIVHKWYSSWNIYETYVLRQGSPNYVLGIPDAEVNYNEACFDNVRENIVANQ